MFQKGDPVLGGRYRIEDLAGEGSSCVVFRATRVEDGVPAAVRAVASFIRKQRPVATRLRERAEFAKNLDHPNLLSVFEVREDLDSFLIAERWTEALPLLRVERGKGACSPFETAWIVERLARGVDHLISSGAPAFDFTLSDVYADIGDLRREQDFFATPVNRWPELEIRLSPLALDGEEVCERTLTTPTDSEQPLVKSVARVAFHLVTGGMGDPLSEPVLSESFTATLRGCLSGRTRFKTARELLWALFGDFGPEFTAILSGRESPRAREGASPAPPPLASPTPPPPPAAAMPRTVAPLMMPQAPKKRSPMLAIIAGLLVIVLPGAAYLAYRHVQKPAAAPPVVVKTEDSPRAVEPLPAPPPVKEPDPPVARPEVPAVPVVPPPVVKTEEEPPSEKDRDLVEYRLKERREAEVRAVYYLRTEHQIEGGTTPLTIRVEGNTSGRARVGLKRERIAGTGVMWDGSVWVAAFVASQSLGQPVTDHEFEVISAGTIDGPSAGMLITATMTALMTKQEILPDTTMTGTVNPDGTCGPVSGIIEKLEGAAKSGIKRFGYPAGKRLAQQHSGGDLIDVEERAKQLGIAEVVEIATLADAYRFLTGKPHPANGEAAAHSRALPRIDTALLKRLRTSRQAIAAQTAAADGLLLESAAKTFGDASEQLKQITGMVQSRAAVLQEAEVSEKKGAFAVGFYRTIGALAGAMVDEMTLGVNLASKRDGFSGAASYLRGESAGLGGRSSELAGKVATYLQSADLSGRIDALNLAGMLQEAEIYRKNGELQLDRMKALLAGQDGTPKTLSPWEELLVNLSIRQATTSIALAKCRLATADRWQEIAPATSGVTVEMDPEFFDQQGRSYALAAESSLVLLNSVARESWKTICRERFEGRSLEEFPLLLWEIEPFYDRAEVAVGLTLRRQMSPGIAGAEGAPDEAAGPGANSLVSLLGSGAFAYLEVSKMMLRWYNFPDVEWWSVAESKHSAAFGEFIDAARDNALAKALRAERICGRVPESILLNLHLGDELRHGSSADKLSSFVSFWKSSLYSDLLIAAYKDSLRKE